ncbi:MAG TPA: ABC transporter permease, partial [Rubrivivax sp.]|nr:ABC transporter permease [Rubrivivax sp.]
MPKFVLLWTDAAIWLLTAALLAYVVFAWRRPNLRTSWRKVFMDAPSLASSIVLLLCLAVCLLDSVHYRPLLPPAPGTTAVAYDARTRSLLDAWLADLVDGREATY